MNGFDASFYYRPQRSCEGYVFTCVCDSIHGGGGVLSQHALQVVSQYALQQGGICSWGVCSQGGLLWEGSAPGGGGACSRGCGDPPESRRLLLRTVRILLECILVSTLRKQQFRVDAIACVNRPYVYLSRAAMVSAFVLWFLVGPQFSLFSEIP